MSDETTVEEHSLRTVAQLRQERGLSVQQLAAQTNIPDHILRMIERRHYLPSPEQVEHLCAFFGVPKDEIDFGLPEVRKGIYGTGGVFA